MMVRPLHADADYAAAAANRNASAFGNQAIPGPVDNEATPSWA